jgi:hypothetical protein
MDFNKKDYLLIVIKTFVFNNKYITLDRIRGN